MPRICYVEQRFNTSSRAIIDHANAIITEYVQQGFQLTLRMLYYKFVSRNLLRNDQKEYKRLGSIVNDARLAGLIDWAHLEDLTRHLHELAHWDGPDDIVRAYADHYHVDLWEKQKTRVEVWLEKDAVMGVFRGVCDELDVPYFSCRGYTSQSEMWRAAQRLQGIRRRGQKPVILHFGDHDPSGLDMTRDIRERLEIFGARVELHRLALNMDQVEEFNPPPNPAKMSDSRAREYVAQYGEESWELDALEPAVVTGLVRSFVEGVIDRRAWTAARKRIAEGRKQLARVAADWAQIVRRRPDEDE